MYDYMRALRQRFDTPPECEKLSQKLARAHEELHSFISGHRIACGIQRELSDQSPYTFDREEEENARVLNEEERLV